MKAILIKILPATNTLGSRYKATVQGQKPLTVSLYGSSFDCSIYAKSQIEQMADIAVKHFGFNNLDHAVGQLPNGDHVIVLINKAAK